MEGVTTERYKVVEREVGSGERVRSLHLDVNDLPVTKDYRVSVSRRCSGFDLSCSSGADAEDRVEYRSGR